MCVFAVRYLDIIYDKPIALMLVIWLIPLLTLVNTMKDPTLITNHNRPASVDTVIVVGYMALASSVRVNDDTM